MVVCSNLTFQKLFVCVLYRMVFCWNIPYFPKQYSEKRTSHARVNIFFATLKLAHMCIFLKSSFLLRTSSISFHPGGVWRFLSRIKRENTIPSLRSANFLRSWSENFFTAKIRGIPFLHCARKARFFKASIKIRCILVPITPKKKVGRKKIHPHFLAPVRRRKLSWRLLRRSVKT